MPGKISDKTKVSVLRAVAKKSPEYVSENYIRAESGAHLNTLRKVLDILVSLELVETLDNVIVNGQPVKAYRCVDKWSAKMRRKALRLFSSLDMMNN